VVEVSFGTTVHAASWLAEAQENHWYEYDVAFVQVPRLVVTTSPKVLDPFGVEITGAPVFNGAVLTGVTSDIQTLPLPRIGESETVGEVALAAMNDPPPVATAPPCSL
jgi:hypothetical protein